MEVFFIYATFWTTQFAKIRTFFRISPKRFHNRKRTGIPFFIHVFHRKIRRTHPVKRSINYLSNRRKTSFTRPTIGKNQRLFGFFAPSRRARRSAKKALRRGQFSSEFLQSTGGFFKVFKKATEPKAATQTCASVIASQIPSMPITIGKTIKNRGVNKIGSA